MWVQFPLLILTTLHLTSAWNNDELELFDLVEEVNQNFYTLLDIPQDAEAADVKKAFRKLSLKLHPDKNPAADAEVKFRQLVAVYDVIRDSTKRQRYNDVLVNGLPDWRSAVYYYRRVRKMGLAEMSVILFVIISVGQYLVSWASYLEQRFNAEQFLSSKARKYQKRIKKSKGENVDIVEEVLAEIPVPSIKNTLPFQIPKLLWWLVTGFPCFIQEQLELRKQRLEEERLLEKERQTAAEAAAAAAAIEQERGPRRRKGGGFTAPELIDDVSSAPTQAQILAQAKREMLSSLKKPAQSGGLWTDDDIVELIKLVKKFPTGTLERWEKIAEAMERSVAEVTHMAHKVKEDGYRAPIHDNGDGEGGAGEDLALMGKSKKVKTRGGKLGLEAEPTQADDNTDVADSGTLWGGLWNQVQQKALEAALLKYPKGSTQDRWEKISKCVPDKTKEECMLRFKHLVDMVKKKKEKEEAVAASDGELCPPHHQKPVAGSLHPSVSMPF